MQLTKFQNDHMDKLVSQYKRTEEKIRRRINEGNSYVPGISRYEEMQWMHKEMANGGTAGTAGSGLPGQNTIRREYYSGYPNEFFQTLCDRMGWNWRDSEEQ